MNDTEKLQAIYDDATNINLSWFWDDGVKVSYGASRGDSFKTFPTVKEAIDFLWSEHVKWREGNNG